jgi:nucleotide-binding universal stress UspA family protein
MEVTMVPRHDHIACCVDESEASRAALREAARLREQLAAASLTLLHARAPGVNVGVWAAPVMDEIDPAAEEWLVELARETPGSRPVLLDGVMSRPEVEAVAWAESNGVDLIVAASHRGAIARTLLGSFSSYLAHHATCPVLLIPPSARSRSAA